MAEIALDISTSDPSADRFRKYVLLSLALHVSVVLALTVRTFFFPSQPIEFQSALRVDLVALPDKLPAPAAAPEMKAPEPTVKPESKPLKAEPDLVLNPKKPNKTDDSKLEKKQDESINRLKQLSALERLEQQAKQDAMNKPRVYKGNAISKGSDLTGLSRLEHDEYVSNVEQHVRQFWALPQWLANKGLRAQVRVRFDSYGRVIAKTMVKSSGNPAFDEVVMNTVEQASPAPPPPEKFLRLLENEGILFGFPE